MASIACEKIKTLAVLSSNKKSSFELSLVKWGNNEAKYDLRKWGDNGKTPYKGITFNKSELEIVYRTLNSLPEFGENLSIYKKTKIGKLDAIIYSILGEFKSNTTMKGYITYMSWGNSPKIDIRCWNDDFTTCSKGATLSSAEKDILLSCLKDEFDFEREKISYDTSDIDDLLFL